MVQTSYLFYPMFNCPVQETMRALADMRRSAKEKELNALLSGDNDSFSCFIEVYLMYHLKNFQCSAQSRVLVKLYLKVETVIVLLRFSSEVINV